MYEGITNEMAFLLLCGKRERDGNVLYIKLTSFHFRLTQRLTCLQALGYCFLGKSFYLTSSLTAAFKIYFPSLNLYL